MSPRLLEIPPDINKISGPPLLTLLFNCGLFGVLSVQVYLYNLAFPKDPTHTKLLVNGIYIFEAVQTILIIYSAYWMFVTKFGDPTVFDDVGLVWLSVPVMTAIVTSFVQFYYAYRINILARSRRVGPVIVVFSIIQLGGGIAVGVWAKQNVYFSELDEGRAFIIEAINMALWNTGSAVCDITIAVCMIYFLSRYESRVRQTQMIVKRVIRLTMETGSLTAVLTLVCFALTVLPGNPVYWQTIMGIIGKVYANSMLVLINSRIKLFSDDDPQETQLSTLKFGQRDGAPGNDGSIFDTEAQGTSIIYGLDTTRGRDDSAQASSVRTASLVRKNDRTSEA